MTAPIIPAGEWPEWADRHCWDENGDGSFLGAALNCDGNSWWNCVDQPSGIPMPDGWDWRVPVMRPQSAPAIDFEPFRELLKQWEGSEYPLSYEGTHSQRALDACIADLQDLIDEQTKCPTCGTTIEPHPMTGTICGCALRPTKGEGE